MVPVPTSAPPLGTSFAAAVAAVSYYDDGAASWAVALTPLRRWKAQGLDRACFTPCKQCALVELGQTCVRHLAIVALPPA